MNWSKQIANQSNYIDNIRIEYESTAMPMVISGCIELLRDEYLPSSIMSETEARDYPSEQITKFRDTYADLVAVVTMNYAEKAIGIVLAAKEFNMSEVISFYGSYKQTSSHRTILERRHGAN